MAYCQRRRGLGLLPAHPEWLRPHRHAPRLYGSYSIADAVERLNEATATDLHEFWPDDVSLSDPTLFDASRILGPKQITDLYLLGLAVRHGGRLITLDRSIPLSPVRGATEDHLYRL